MTQYVVLRSYDGIPDDDAYGPFPDLNAATGAASILFQKDLEESRKHTDDEFVVDQDGFSHYPEGNEDAVTEFAILPLKTVEL